MYIQCSKHILQRLNAFRFEIVGGVYFTKWVYILFDYSMSVIKIEISWNLYKILYFARMINIYGNNQYSFYKKYL